LVDGQALFHAIGPHGLLNDYLFHDAMHPSLRGFIALAEAIVEVLRARHAFGWATEPPSPKIDLAECASHFGLKPADWQIIAERGSMFYCGAAALRYEPNQRRAKCRAFEEAARRIVAGEAAESLGLPNLGAQKRETEPTSAPLRARPPASSNRESTSH
jgi:hypothetical protein